MQIFKKLPLIFILGLGSCSTIPKSYFTTDTRNKIEEKSIAVDKLQYYVDSDVELRRELSSRDAKVSISGKVKFENGKYIHIILLKKGTLGVCTGVHKNTLDITFESGDGKNLTFGVPDRAGAGTVYRLFADQWIRNNNVAEIGKVTYDGEIYFIQHNGSGPVARLMIRKSVTDKFEVNKRVMSGRKVG